MANCYDIILHHVIPPQEVLDLLTETFPQKWLDGDAKSIADPRYNHGRDLMPVKVLHLWKEVARAVRIQKEWREAYQTVENAVQSPEVSRYYLSAAAVFGQRGWDEGITIDETFTTYTFSHSRNYCDPS
ncbi:hypothetical protein D9758_006223 [Tetrapyrgos nigripes]|uniref:Uncharacterized protein n=1 Tax=Tetrapyrgos nigripes TaxID=182062 RepID=A0A8H5LLG6_9AGAR|nr:hypothetical protein D9758_006223 [Tetrapyrgos nigripes]